MTTRITKKTAVCSHRGEVIDRTRRGHQTPTLLLNPLQYSELVKCAGNGTDNFTDLGNLGEERKQQKQHASEQTMQKNKPSNTVLDPPAKALSANDGEHHSEDVLSSVGAAEGSVRSKASSKSERQKAASEKSLEAASSNEIASTFSKSNTAEDYNFPGQENTPEMRQLMTLRGQLHAMQRQVKQQAEQQKRESDKLKKHPELVSDNPHYCRWEPKLLFDDIRRNRKIRSNWVSLKFNQSKDNLRRSPLINGEKGNGDLMGVVNDEPKVSKRRAASAPGKLKDTNAVRGSSAETESNANYDIDNENTYPKAVFQRSGQFEPDKIRKRYVHAKTYWLQGDGYEGHEREKLVQKPKQEHITTYEVLPGDVRYVARSQSASCISTNTKLSSKSSIPLKENTYHRGDEKMANDAQLDFRIKKPHRHGSSVGGNPEGNLGTELPHQRHQDIRNLKNIFSKPRPYYNRLKRDREMLTQLEKETMLLEESKRDALDKTDAIQMAEKELASQPDPTPELRSALLLHQVQKGRLRQLSEKAEQLQQQMQEARRWDNKARRQQIQHQARLLQKLKRKTEEQNRTRRVLNSLMQEQYDKQQQEQQAAVAELERLQQEHQRHKQHLQALASEKNHRKQQNLKEVKEEVARAQQKHDDRDLHYAVTRRREYRTRKRDKFLKKSPTTPPAVMMPPDSQEPADTRAKSMFQTVK